MAPGTAISDAQISGTSWKPILRAASAGNSAVRSGVAVNSTLITSSVVSSLRVMTSVTSSAVPSSIASRSSVSICTAPRTALTVILASPSSGATLHAPGGVRLADFPGRQVARDARLEVAEPDRAHVGADQAGHRVPGGGQHPPYDVLAALVQGDLDQRAVTGPVHDPELVRGGHAIVQLDPGLEAPGEVLRHRAGDLGQVGLGHLEAGVGQPVRELTVVGEQHQALGVVIQPADVEQPLGAVAQVVRPGLAAAW